MGTSKKYFLKRGVDYPIVDGARTLPGKYYHSEEIYKEEVEKIFISFGYSHAGQKKYPQLAIIN